VDAYSTSLTRSAAAALGQARKNMAYAQVGDYAIFAGGYPSTKDADAYNAALTRTAITPISQNTSNRCGASISGFALIQCGSSAMDAYDAALTKSIAPPLSESRSELVAAESIGQYALFGGGSPSSDVVDAYYSN